MISFKAKTSVQASFWLAATIVGITAVAYAKCINILQGVYFHYYHLYPTYFLISTPLLFLSATFIVVKFAPEARGSGIPQVLQAIDIIQNKKNDPRLERLVSIRTAAFKIISTFFGILGGSSIGREGPTVQIASSVFSWVSKKTKRYVSNLDTQSYLVAGAAAGIAAAFNTPIAGITFALEEIATETFVRFKQTVMFSIIIGGIVAQAILGNYLYFGHPTIHEVPFLSTLTEALVLGFLGGGLGALFGRLLTLTEFQKFKAINWKWKALGCGFIIAAINFMSHGTTAGSGYEVVNHFMANPQDQMSPIFWAEKFITTVFSYFSGMAGGIFAPCLSIGAGLGSMIASLSNLANPETCALIGMVAFFSGVVQAPITAVVIVMEMTDEHNLILSFMITALLAQVISRTIMPHPLYHCLAFGNRKETEEVLL